MMTSLNKDAGGNWIVAKQPLTLAAGEATGHHHTLYPVAAGVIVESILDDKGAVYRFRVSGGDAELRHQEHHTLKIVPGVYEITHEREYDYFENEMKKVVD